MADSATVGAGDNSTDAARDQAEQIYMLVSFWVGAVLYGIYMVLFFGAVRIMTKDKLQRSAVTLIFFISMIIMFTMNTIQFGINIHRFIEAYAKGATPVPGMPISYFRDFTAWENFAWPVIVTVMVLHADALVIFRCFIVWKRNYYVIILPTLMLLLSIAVNTITLFWFANPTKMAFETAHPFFGMVYPLNLAQNILTTGLIAFKIWYHHAQTKASGLTIAFGLDLITLVRIIVESALIYTIQQMVLLILYYVNHPAQLILHAMVVPTVGIVFALMAIRTHAAKMEASEARYPHSSILLQSSSRPGHSTAIIASVTTQQQVDYDSQPIKMGVLTKEA